MPNRRAINIAWVFLGGVTVIEAIALAFMFQGSLTNLSRLERYLLNPNPGPLAWALAALVVVAYCAYAVIRSPLIGSLAFSPRLWSPFWGLRAISVAEAFVTGIFEEVFFRRFVMDWASHGGYSPLVQIGLSGLVFGVAHGFWGAFRGNFRAAIGATLATGILGVLLGAVYLIGGRSLAPCIAVHVVINLILEPWLIMAAATGSWGRVDAAE